MLENQRARLLVRERGKKGREGKTLCGKLGGEGINMEEDSICCIQSPGGEIM